MPDILKSTEVQKCRFAAKLATAQVTLPVQSVSTLQLNITKLCNQACTHCHVDASPRRRETMSDEVLAACMAVLQENPEIKTLDLTGGAPELHPRFRDLVAQAKGMGKRVIVRHNLTVTLDKHPKTSESLEDLPDFFREHRVEIVSSLPYYQEFFTDKQRGDGVFSKSIESLKRLNSKGYGHEGTGLLLNLVYNPVGAFLPSAQDALEKDYKRELGQRFGIHFNKLFALTNVPIHRFKVSLVRNNGYEEYLEKLVSAFNPDAAAGVMCRSMVSVSYDGYLYDCDFNQMLDLKLAHPSESKTTRSESQKTPASIHDFKMSELLSRKIQFSEHCFACTAGAGSSCGGNTTKQ